jgi:methylated-DNA-[protein]-cysteine S-methyltransferase
VDADLPRELLRTHGLRVTPQRRAILEAFRGGASEHLTADEVFARSRATLPDVGRGTVYATLADFTRLGVLQATGRAEPVRYERNTAVHEHFRCFTCGRLFDVEIAAAGVEALERAGYEVARTSLVAEGTCRACVAFGAGLAEAAQAARVAAREPAAGAACGAVSSPLGELLVAATARGVARVAFAEHPDAAAIQAAAPGAAGGARGCLDAARAAIEAYFATGADTAACPVDWELVAPTGAHVLRAAQAVPYGRPSSYSEVLPELEEAPPSRAAGAAQGANPVPVIVPCHRVLRGTDPVDYVGGLERKLALLARERG